MTRIGDVEIRTALTAVCESDLFAPLERLRAFLTYIVTEELEGRGELIRGKTIAQDVYDRAPNDGSDADNVVRVDARRLRQNLDHYYETAGQSDPVRIFVDMGGYRPRFEQVDIKPEPQAKRRHTFALAVTVFALGTALGAGVSQLYWRTEPVIIPAPPSAENPQSRLEREAIGDKSLAALQAVNLAEQARDMIFPIFDRPRQDLVTEVFRRVIELDPQYFGGHAGAAQTLATLAILTPPGPQKDAHLADARTHADTAINLGPTEPWAQSALSWVKLASRNYDEAMRLSTRAAMLAPEDANILDYHGTVALFSGNFQIAVETAQKAASMGGSNRRFANRNILGAASFHIGDYQQSLKAFSAAAAYGDPISAPSFVYQAAGLMALGRSREAQQKVDQLQKAWPEANVEGMLKSIFADPGYVDELMGKLDELTR